MMEIVGTSTGRGVQTEKSFLRRPKRPIDKSLVAITKDNVGATDVTTTLFTTTFPCTIVGLRWDMAFVQAGGTGSAVVHWCICVNRDGVTVPTLAVSDAAAFFEPEQNCLVYGVSFIDNNTVTEHATGSTKTMRKMMGGDTLVFIMKGTATETSSCRGVIQFFCKT